MTRALAIAALIALAAAAPAPLLRQETSAATDLMIEADNLVERGRLETACERWRTVANAHRKTPQAPTALLRLAEAETDLALALTLIERLRDSYPTSPEAEPALALAGEIHHLLGDCESAAQVYRTYLQDHPGGDAAPVAQDRLITCLIETGQPEEALAVWERAARADPARRADPDAVMQRVEALIALGDHAAASEVLLDVIARFPNRSIAPRAHLAAALCLEAQSRWDEAAQVHRMLIQRWPRCPEARIAGEHLEAVERLQDNLRALTVGAEPR